MKNLLLMILTIFSANDIFCCTCVEHPDGIEGTINNADFIAYGKIVRKGEVLYTDYANFTHMPDGEVAVPLRHYQMKLYKSVFLVQKRYKGFTKTDSITIYTGGECMYDFKENNFYTVFGTVRNNLRLSNSQANFIEGENIFWTNICNVEEGDYYSVVLENIHKHNGDVRLEIKEASNIEAGIKALLGKISDSVFRASLPMLVQFTILANGSIRFNNSKAILKQLPDEIEGHIDSILVQSINTLETGPRYINDVGVNSDWEVIID